MNSPAGAVACAALEQLGGRPLLAAGEGGQGGQHRQAFPGPLIHAGLAPGPVLFVGRVGGGDRAADDPGTPARRVVLGPFGEVKVERPDGGQDAAPVEPGCAAWTGCPCGVSVVVVLVITRCFHAAATSRGSLSELIPGWWVSRSRQNSLPRW